MHDVILFGYLKGGVFFFVVCSYSLCVPVVNCFEAIGETIDDAPFDVEDAFE